MLDCLSLLSLLELNLVDSVQMFTPGIALLAKRTEIKVKRAKYPLSIADVPSTPIYYSSFAVNTVALLELFFGVAGVYQWTDLRNPGRFYVGSTINLGSRLEAYKDLMTGHRKPTTTVEREFYNTGISS